MATMTEKDGKFILTLDETEAVCLSLAIAKIEPNAKPLFFQKIDNIRKAINGIKIPPDISIVSIFESTVGEITAKEENKTPTSISQKGLSKK